MSQFVLLLSWTEEGLHKVVTASKESNSGLVMLGIKDRLVTKLKDIGNSSLIYFYWTLGATDMLAVVELPSDVYVAGLALWLSENERVRTQTMRAYTDDEIGRQPGDDTVAGILYRCYAG